jgi:hypothetical protein
MNDEVQHCRICAWRHTCKLKYKVVRDGKKMRYCPEFSRDVTIPLNQETPDTKDKTGPEKKPSKRYFSIPVKSETSDKQKKK